MTFCPHQRIVDSSNLMQFLTHCLLTHRCRFFAKIETKILTIQKIILWNSVRILSLRYYHRNASQIVNIIIFVFSRGKPNFWVLSLSFLWLVYCLVLLWDIWPFPIKKATFCHLHHSFKYKYSWTMLQDSHII